ncbi:hypothetical protein KP509_29G067600 [Ceratopteris richardii]|uniref:MYND-type domain-containing protein n=1 Tax=Ceratopteris richardii TaxID=49495 RepID=A0A8T2R7V1_CERRI|nr:hypothetical protein KP509_29G067600 [Ceratopteris richardii]
MRTRRASYGDTGVPRSLKRPRRKRCCDVGDVTVAHICDASQKRARWNCSTPAAGGSDGECPPSCSFLDRLPDDLLISVLACVSSSAESPKDILNTALTCKRFMKLTGCPAVMREVSKEALRVDASRWCTAAAAYLTKCADAGNLEACFILGMIQFYCLTDRKAGLDMLGKAAAGSHGGALHALAVIHFNGSGGGRADKNLRAGVLLCARAAVLRHVDAMRELGHCLQDGYGVLKNVIHGRRLILEANIYEASMEAKTLQSVFRSSDGVSASACLAALASKMKVNGPKLLYRLLDARSHSMASDFGCSVAPPPPSIAHKFLRDWFKIRSLPPGLRMCSHSNCGRPETRRHEFRRCSACGLVNYCSRACQAMDWKLQHKLHCASVVRWQNRALFGLPHVGGGPVHYIHELGNQ